MDELALRILIIDDNPAIHDDFIKVLSATKEGERLNDLGRQLFDTQEESNLKVNARGDTILPQFVFETASQGKEGLDKIKQSIKKNQPFALAFVDIRMPPGWDGIETIQRIWQVDPDIQIVICTAYSDYTWEETVQKLGVGDNYLILKKPFDAIAVRQLACALTQKWVLANKARAHEQTLNNTLLEKTSSLRHSLSLLNATLESSSDGILVVDFKGRILDSNSNFRQMWQIPEDLLSTKDSRLLFEYMSQQVADSDAFEHRVHYLQSQTENNSSFTTALANNTILESNTQPYLLNGEIIGRIWCFHDITERAKLQKKLEFQALHDMLTGLPNRVLLMDRMQQLIDSSERHQQAFAVLFFDLDRFKLVNDSLSHAVGDELLQAVAKRLLLVGRREDTLARLGGDEFVMLIPELETEAQAINIANKIINLFAEPFLLSDREFVITTSVGISLFPNDGKDVNQLLKNADLAMYNAKELGGNQYQFYTDHLNSKIVKRMKIESDMRRALANHEFYLVYQPQFDINTNELLSAEALVRWALPDKEQLLPLDFIPVAEESGLIVPLGEWVIEEACRQIKTWEAKGLPLIRVAVNIATQQLRQANFAERVQQILDKYQLNPAYLEFEITENVVITHSEIIYMINELKKLGVHIVLDDFGTGNSSINYLKQIHIDRLKIDQTFIRNMSTSRTDEVIVEAIIAMAKSFDFKVVAEGVENSQQIQFLKQQHCDEVQGFHLSKPLSPKQFERFVKKWH